MGVNKTADDVETLGIPVGSAPPDSTAETQAIGKPWSTGLYDCHENQTNGIIILLFYYFLFYSS